TKTTSAWSIFSDVIPTGSAAGTRSTKVSNQSVSPRVRTRNVAHPNHSRDNPVEVIARVALFHRRHRDGCDQPLPGFRIAPLAGQQFFALDDLRQHRRPRRPEKG